MADSYGAQETMTPSHIRSLRVEPAAAQFRIVRDLLSVKVLVPLPLEENRLFRIFTIGIEVCRKMRNDQRF